MRAVRPKLTPQKEAKMPDYTDDYRLFAECLQAEATYGTLLPCEHFAARREYEPETGAACLSEGMRLADADPMNHFGRN